MMQLIFCAHFEYLYNLLTVSCCHSLYLYDKIIASNILLPVMEIKKIEVYTFSKCDSFYLFLELTMWFSSTVLLYNCVLVRSCGLCHLT